MATSRSQPNSRPSSSGSARSQTATPSLHGTKPPDERTLKLFYLKQVKQLKRIFDTHDVDHDNQVTAAEFIKAISDESAQERGLDTDYSHINLFQTMDKNHDNVLDFEEYLRVYFKDATPDQIKLMVTWAYPTSGPTAEEKRLSQYTEDELELAKKIYVDLLVKDQNGLVPRVELEKLGRPSDFGPYI